MERLKRLREPAVVIALVGLVVHLALSVLWAVRYPAPLGATFATLANLIVPPVLLVLLTALLLSCWLAEPTPHARGLTVTGLVLTVALVAGVAALAVASVTTDRGADGGALASLPWLVAPVTVAVVSLAAQVALLRPPPAGTAATAPAELESARPDPEPVDPQHQPTWTSDAAVGTVWRRAGDAASQRPATSWDAPGQSGGWGDAVPDSDPPAEPTRRPGE
jgi:hypothetical protein